MTALMATRQPSLLAAPLPKRLGAEFIGTFMLVFAGAGAIVISAYENDAISHEGIAACFGLVIMILIYALGHISGAHFNPGVTLAFAIARHFHSRDVIPYWLAQMAGAFAGAALLRALFGNVAHLGATLPADSESTAFVLELVMTFFLMFVITAVATDSRAIGQAAAIAIGATVGLEALFGGPISGASMNTARSLAPAVVSGDLRSIWLYVVAPPLGAVLGVTTYEFLRGDNP